MARKTIWMTKTRQPYERKTWEFRTHFFETKDEAKSVFNKLKSEGKITSLTFSQTYTKPFAWAFEEKREKQKKPYFKNKRAEAARLGWIKRKKAEKKKEKENKKNLPSWFQPIDLSWMKIRK